MSARYSLRRLGKHKFGFDVGRRLEKEQKEDEESFEEDEVNSSEEEEEEDELHKQLSTIYHNPADSGSFGGVRALVRSAREHGIRGATESRVRRFLSGVSAYTLHKQVRKRFTRNRTYVSGVDDQWQADLVDMRKLAKQNRGYNYLLTCIDVFSKYAWVVPVKEKNSRTMYAAFQELFKNQKRVPNRLQTDKGLEFFNTPISKLLRDKQINHFASWSDQKAAVVERFNRTLKTRMWRYFSARNTKSYLSALPHLVHAYNNSLHRVIGMTPTEASLPENSKAVRAKLYPSTEGTLSAAAAAAAGNPPEAGCHPQPPRTSTTTTDVRLEPGTRVRISKWKGEFEKGYMPNWSMEEFRVRERVDPLTADTRTVYKLEDLQGEPIMGIFYREELQPITRNRYRVEKVLRTRGSGDQKQYFVKWLGWPEKFNTWISSKQRQH